MRDWPEEIRSLPLYPHLDGIAQTLARQGLLLLHAEPGAGKTTLVPWRLLRHEAFAGAKILLLEPRRMAARAAAERIAALAGESPGGTVGLRTRLETLVSPQTRLEVVTEGVLTRIIQNNPSLASYGVIIFDEFHERTLAGDLSLAFAWECRSVFRRNLRLLFMSATPPAGELMAAIGALPVLSVPGRAWPVETVYRPPATGESSWDGAARLAAEARERLDRGGGGGVLVFLPGFREIRRAQSALARRWHRPGPEIVVLHGRLPPEQQRLALMPAPEPAGRIILATNVAETSLTIPGVCAVVDSGLERRVRFHPRTGMDHWETTEISEASATQRQGRAGRLGPGVCLRWWHPSVPRRPFSTPEILEADLAPLLLETALWGAASPDDLTWITPPPAGALHQAAELLRELDLLDTAGRITATGRKVAGMGLHPRLGRMILTAAQRGWLATAAITAAILAEGDPLGGGDPDFRDRLKAWAEWAKGKPGGLRPETARRIGAEARRIIRAAGAGGSVPGGGDIDAALAGRLLLLAYPDRAAQRVGGGLPGEAARLVLATGRGATVNGPLAQEEFLAIAELDGSEKTAHLFLAAPVLRTEIEDGLAGQPQTVVRYAWEGWSLRCLLETRVGGLVLGRKGGTAPDPADVLKAVGERLAQEGIDALPWSDRTRRFAARCRFVGRCGVPPPRWPDFAPATLLAEVKEWLFPFLDCRGTGTVINADLLLQALEGRLGRRYLHRLDELAPETWELPSGTRKRLDYETGEVPVLAARLQEFFGCRRTPCLCGQPLLLHLLSPAGRPVQVTGDLDGFWDRGYPEVKKELHGRYPRHHWPGDPRAVPPTARAKKRK